MSQDLLLARIMSGYTLLILNTNTYLIGIPSSLDKIYAEEIYSSSFDEDDSSFSTDSILDFLEDNDIWSNEDEIKLIKLQKDVEDIKVNIYENWLNTPKREFAKESLQKTLVVLMEYLKRRHCYDQYTSQGIAQLTKKRFLLAMAIRNEAGKKLFNRKTYQYCDSIFIDSILAKYEESSPSEEEIRNLVHNPVWRSHWAARKSGLPIFKKQITDLSEFQLRLINWSITYDAISEHPDAPHDEIIVDNDALDGWMIIQQRKRQDAIDKQSVESKLTNEKIRNSPEVFIPVGNAADAKKVDKANDPHARMIKGARFNALKEKRELNECELPDVKRELQMRRNRGPNG